MSNDVLILEPFAADIQFRSASDGPAGVPALRPIAWTVSLRSRRRRRCAAKSSKLLVAVAELLGAELSGAWQLVRFGRWWAGAVPGWGPHGLGSQKDPDVVDAGAELGGDVAEGKPLMNEKGESVAVEVSDRAGPCGLGGCPFRWRFPGEGLVDVVLFEALLGVGV